MMAESDTKDTEKAAEGEDLLFGKQVTPYEKNQKGCCMCGKKTFIIIAVILGMLFLYALGLAIGLAIGLNKSDEDTKEAKIEVPIGAVVSDHEACSDIGRDILMRHGTAVDAAIATLVCNGMRTPHSMGIGGGCFMVIYDKHDKESTFINGRETAPRLMTPQKYDNMSNGGFMVVYDRGARKAETFNGFPAAPYGMTATVYDKLTNDKIEAREIGVPGELKAYKAAHMKYGRLPWKDLFEPTIKMVKHGYPIGKSTEKALAYVVIKMKELGEKMKLKINLTHWPQVCEIFCADTTTGEPKKAGDMIYWPKMVDTLQHIADDGPDWLYSSPTTYTLVKELQEIGGIIDQVDLTMKYKVKIGDAYKIQLGNYTLYTMGDATGGPVTGLISNILHGMGLKSDDMSTPIKKADTYHKIIEAMKFAYADRKLLGDPEYDNVTSILEKMQTNAYADAIRSKIDPVKTHDELYYTDIAGKYEETPGTSHVSVLSPYGDAVSVTSTINWYFGSGIMSNSTGILWNNEMKDFGTLADNDTVNLPEPGKRPRSSMVPLIVVDQHGMVKLVTGGAGGSFITNAVVQVLIKLLYLDQPLEDAMEDKRFHHMLSGNLTLEEEFPEDIKKALEAKGHKTTVRTGNYMGVLETIFVNDDGVIQAYADTRKLPGDASFVYDKTL